MKKHLLSSILISTLIISAVGQTSTGFLSPSSTAAPNGWSNPANVFLSDDVYASVPHGAGCHCPWVSLSWNNGASYTSSILFGPYSTVDGSQIKGGTLDTLGHSWTDTEFSSTNFLLKIANPSMSYEQGYKNFNFNIPGGAIINGIEVKVEGHGDEGFTTEFIDLIQVNVHYTTIVGVNELASSKNHISVYPNPFSFETTLKSNYNLINATLTFYNSYGQQVKQIKNISEQTITINRDNLISGMYIMQLTQDNKIFATDKLVIVDN